MKKTMLKTAIFSLAVIGLTANNVMAIPGYDGFDEFEVLNPDTFAVINLNNPDEFPFDATDPGDDGFYIWTDALRNELTVLWTGDQENGDTRFKGNINLLGIGAEGATVKYEFGAGQNNDSFTLFGNSVEFRAWAGSGGSSYYDGFILTFTQEVAPSYITFDLMTSKDNPIVFTHEDTKIFFGAAATRIVPGTDGTFAIQAPIPEPSTMLLFGAGLLGLAGAARRRKK